MGDWEFHRPKETGDIELHVLATRMPDWRYTMLLMIHELVEAVLCYGAGVTTEAVDRFDLDFIASHPNQEPGDDPRAPYHSQHRTASIVEQLVAKELGVDWIEYDNAVEDVRAGRDFLNTA